MASRGDETKGGDNDREQQEDRGWREILAGDAHTQMRGNRFDHEQCDATRAAVIDAAARLFAERGYAATTMAAIAAEARVAVKSVYTLAEKPQLLLLAVDRSIVGDDQPVALFDRPEAQGRTQRATALAARIIRTTGRWGPTIEGPPAACDPQSPSAS